MISGYMYLHENGDLIYKRNLDDGGEADLRESDAVRMFWPLDLAERLDAWDCLLAAALMGARPKRVAELRETWGIDDADAAHYASHCKLLVDRDGDKWCATASRFENLAESYAGFGDDWFGAIVDLLRDTGYQPRKLWGNPASAWLLKH